MTFTLTAKQGRKIVALMVGQTYEEVLRAIKALETKVPEDGAFTVEIRKDEV